MISKFKDFIKYKIDSYRVSSIDNSAFIDNISYSKPLKLKVNYHTNRYISNTMEIEDFYHYYNASMLKKDMEICLKLISYKEIYNKLCIYFPDAAESVLKEIEKEIRNNG